MEAYFKGAFPQDLKHLHTELPNSVVREHILGGDASVTFFGGGKWSRVAADLSGIAPATRPHFILSLFMVISTEQCLHARFPQAQPAWRARTGFPLFGWSGFGVHNENPYHILRAPVAAGLVDEAAAVALAPAFGQFFFSEVAAYFGASGLGVRPQDLFAAMRADETYGPATAGRVRGQSGALWADRDADAAAGAGGGGGPEAGAALVRAVAAALGPL